MIPQSAPRKEKNPQIWFRILALAVTLGAFFFIFRKVDFSQLAKTFSQMNVGWFLAATLFFGFAFILGGWRLHLMLRLTDSAVHCGASTRIVLIGHFFYTVFFGAAGGDVARTGLYVRWFKMPLPRVLAAISLDRLLGLSGIILVGGIAFLFATLNGSFPQRNLPGLKISSYWLVLLPLFGLSLFLIWRWQSKSNSALANSIRSFGEGFRKFLIAPRLAAGGLFSAFLVQLALCAVLALCLRAVCHTAIPWSKLFWVFPVIFMVSALPITIGGLGFREGAAMTLLGWYQIPASDAVAAALLAFLATVIWAVVGGIIFLREEKLYKKNVKREIPQKISVVIPTWNEEKTLPETIRCLRAIPEIFEIIVVDGGSSDKTREVAQRLNCCLLSSASGRGNQMRLGASRASGDVILLLHADSSLPPEAGRALQNCLRDKTVVGGGFWKVFRQPTFLLLGSKWKCLWRLYVARRIAGDQAIFVRREALETIGGVPSMPLMEEFELCKRLRKIGRLALAEAVVETSARRFLENGILRTYLRMWHVMIKYYLGSSPEELRALYEKKNS